MSGPEHRWPTRSYMNCTEAIFWLCWAMVILNGICFFAVLPAINNADKFVVLGFNLFAIVMFGLGVLTTKHDINSWAKREVSDASDEDVVPNGGMPRGEGRHPREGGTRTATGIDQPRDSDGA